MYQLQLNFSMSCARRAFGISWKHLNHPNLLVGSVFEFHVYFHTRIILYHFCVNLPHEDAFNKVTRSCIKSAYYSICDDCGTSDYEIWINCNCFYTLAYGSFGDGGKDMKRFPHVV